MNVSEHANYLLNEYGRLQFDYAAYCKPDGEPLRNEARNNLETYIAELEAAQRWIPVSERLPQIYDDCEGEKSDCCYVRDIHKCVWIAYYRPDEKDWYGLPTGIILTAITHWMPLPQLPEVKE